VLKQSLDAFDKILSADCPPVPTPLCEPTAINLSTENYTVVGSFGRYLNIHVPQKRCSSLTHTDVGLWPIGCPPYVTRVFEVKLTIDL